MRNSGVRGKTVLAGAGKLRAGLNLGTLRIIPCDLLTSRGGPQRETMRSNFIPKGDRAR
jgi:hypothetical protein